MINLFTELNTNILKLYREESGRVFHGRGKQFEGCEDITVEYLSGILLVVMFQDRPLTWRREFLKQVNELPCSEGIDQIFFQARYERGAPVYNELGDESTLQSTIKENGLKYQLNLGGRQNYGFFTDMSEGRKWVSAHSLGRKVLNLFSYTCSFSVAAISGGAEQVVNVDMSSAALSVGRVNHQLNNQSLERVAFQKLNILKSWGRISRLGPYDLVIVDPPSFQKGSFSAVKDYRKIVTRLEDMTIPGADVLFCLNDPLTVVGEFKAMLDEGGFSFVGRVDNPAVMKEVEQEVGLKVLHYRKVV